MKKWCELLYDDKLDFVIEYLNQKETRQDVINLAYEIILFNKMVDPWYDVTDTIAGIEWDLYQYKDKANLILDEISNDWSKQELIDFIVDNMTNLKLEDFENVYKLTDGLNYV